MNREYVIERYRTPDGGIPFTEWIDNLKRRDLHTAFRILVRIDRAEKGNFGDYKYLRDGVWEMRIDCGPGYRLYFAFENKRIVLLLIAGDKRSQKADINKAVSYWKTHQAKEFANG
ncbi:addiction module killer protein [Trabulsiella odontotermitis]|uniref:Addiction module killer protein n=2 Tax=Trabulsiella odontotermitis TaxID=379893 RepID=A0A0L0H269_9ENTR|nr:type II toxin-antitoxin system RelE/ParE family toxin [Trabulsiella odontotermitis]KNC91642.1 addiction module killer protein [Trabulsiella odontotermitis]KNC95297.1 addiction module killer protein [Trabulsiella odontotermitis]